MNKVSFVNPTLTASEVSVYYVYYGHVWLVCVCVTLCGHFFKLLLKGSVDQGLLNVEL